MADVTERPDGLICLCDSGRPRASCHETIVTELYRSARSEPLSYDLPSHMNRNQSRFMADRLSHGTSYDIAPTDRHWRLRQRDSSVPSFVLVPLVRPAVSPNVRAIADAFAGVVGWPTDSATEKQRQTEPCGLNKARSNVST